jgi:hypothetical protein
MKKRKASNLIIIEENNEKEIEIKEINGNKKKVKKENKLLEKLIEVERNGWLLVKEDKVTKEFKELPNSKPNPNIIKKKIELNKIFFLIFNYIFFNKWIKMINNVLQKKLLKNFNIKQKISYYQDINLKKVKFFFGLHRLMNIEYSSLKTLIEKILNQLLKNLIYIIVLKDIM